MIGSIRWNPRLVARFVGCYITEPKAQVYFDPPRPAHGLRQFAAMAMRRGVRLDTRTQMLYDEDQVYVNGTAVDWPASQQRGLKRLANARRLAAAEVARVPWLALLHGWYCDGYLKLD